jgi:hypothetical protein
MPVVSLNGTWKFSMEPPGRFWEDRVDFNGWHDIEVPGECQMQGFAIQHDRPYVYKHRFMVPQDYRGKQVFVDFHGVYSHARVWVNGQFVREHYGGFTRWRCNITEHVKAGTPAVLTVEVTDRADDISYGSGYAKHQIGGILRNVELRALPAQHVEQLYFETDLDDNYEDASLKVVYSLAREMPADIGIELYDAAGKLKAEKEELGVASTGDIVLPVEQPQKWDAEHPNLYKVVVTLRENGRPLLKQVEEIGFREVEVAGNQLLVNGKPVKLRGACRHDIHPLLGRMTTPEYDEMDVILAKKANINFIRTSHYPPSETFLDYCDRYGIYVEDETAVCFVGSHRTEAYRATGASQNDPAFTGRYLSQLEEMVRHHRSHPSIIIWSIGNENAFGHNFVASYNWVKKNDPSRPVIYSYPGQVPDSVQLYDILSMHYPSWQGNLDQYGISIRGFESADIPALYDEWAHVACYNNFEIRSDPNVRNFWGQSLDSMWTNAFVSDGCLGGAIWGMLDETFMLPRELEGFNQWWGILDPNVIPATYMGPCVGYGEWGIADTWRREKPEFWNTKKAYSPTKIYAKEIAEFIPGEELIIPVHNRYDHTDLSELKIIWSYDGRSGQLDNVHLAPHAEGALQLPANTWNTDEKVHLRFYQYDTLLVDEYFLQLGKRPADLPGQGAGDLTVREYDDRIALEGVHFMLDINRKTGLMENLTASHDTLIRSGPYVHLRLPGQRIQYSTIQMDDYARNWQCRDFDFEIVEGIATIRTSGRYDSIGASFLIRIDGAGVCSIDYQIEGAPRGSLMEEAGIKFVTGSAFRTLSWDRKAYFTAYPAGHLSAPHGETDITVQPEMQYRQQPLHAWEQDAKGFYYFGLDVGLPFTNIVRGMKENIYSYALKTAGGLGLEVLSDGTQACRCDRIDGENTLFINHYWDYTSLLWGNYMKLTSVPDTMVGRSVLKIEM